MTQAWCSLFALYAQGSPSVRHGERLPQPLREGAGPGEPPVSMGISWRIPAASSGQEGTFVHGRGRNVVGTSTGSVSVPLLWVRARGQGLRGSPAALGSSRTAQEQGRRAARHRQPCSSHTTSDASLASWDPRAAWPGWDDALALQWKADSQDFRLWPAKWFLSSCQAWKSSFPSTKQEGGWLDAGRGRWGSALVRCCSQILCSQVILRLHPWLCPWPGGTGGFVWLQSSKEGMGAAVLCW